jgi:hypothetical protein
MGPATALEKIKGFHAAGQEVFAPAPLIEKLVAEGQSFADFDKAEG